MEYRRGRDSPGLRMATPRSPAAGEVQFIGLRRYGPRITGRKAVGYFFLGKIVIVARSRSETDGRLRRRDFAARCFYYSLNFAATPGGRRPRRLRSGRAGSREVHSSSACLRGLRCDFMRRFQHLGPRRAEQKWKSPAVHRVVSLPGP